MIVSLVLQFFSRTVFIYCLGETYLGINGLFSNIIGVLSFAELGIGTAINFSLYKPVAENNIEKIKSYMYYYKWAYRVIALIITVLGVIIIPFLDLLVNVPNRIENIKLFYLIFLFNTVTSYLVSYKFSLVNAEQRNYIYTNINMVFSVCRILLQIFSLFIWKNYLIYLLVATAIDGIQKVFVSKYFDKMYPYLKEKDVKKLKNEEKNILIAKVKALIIHKFGEISVHQTDNIIISTFVSTGMVGLLSNYNMLINTISSCINVLFNSVTGSLGNMVAMESKDYQYLIFCRYRFLAFWLYGFSSIALSILSSPFITLWLGEAYVVDSTVINLIIINFYMIGQRICLNNIKSAAGIYEIDKYIAFLQSIVNITISILLVKVIGLKGVFVGTIIQGSLSSVIKPIITFRTLFEKSCKLYFWDSLKYIGATLFAYRICEIIVQNIIVSITVMSFIVSMVTVAIVPNIIFMMIFYNREEFKYFINIVKNLSCL